MRYRFLTCCATILSLLNSSTLYAKANAKDMSVSAEQDTPDESKEKQGISIIDKINKQNMKYKQQRGISKKLEDAQQQKKTTEAVQIPVIAEQKEDELSGEEYTKWSTAKAKTSSKQFRDLVLYYRTIKPLVDKLHDKCIPPNLENCDKDTDDYMYIYGNYEDELGELAGDEYTKWIRAKTKTTTKQFKALVNAYKYMRARLQELLETNDKLNKENALLKKKNKKNKK